MATETCKWCGAVQDGDPADWDHGCGIITRFLCGTSVTRFKASQRTEWFQRERCKDAELELFRNLLRLSPREWGGPITPAVCEQLGMQKTTDRLGTVFWFVPQNCDYVAFDSGNRNGVYLDKTNRQDWCKTAGQLALLVAARQEQIDAPGRTQGS